MRQRLAFVAVKQHDVARFGLAFAQLQTQADPIHLAFRLAPLQRVPGPPPAELFFRSALDNCERLMRTPSRASISARKRGIVQFFLLATGSSSSGVTTRNAVSLLTGGGPGATLAVNAPTPPWPKSLRQSRTVSSRTPNASAICGLVQPARVSSTARARSASPRARPKQHAVRRLPLSETCRPCPTTANRSQQRIAKPMRWSNRRNLLRNRNRRVSPMCAHAWHPVQGIILSRWVRLKPNAWRPWQARFKGAHPYAVSDSQETPTGRPG